MNFLLDTHVALWAITDSPKLPQKARELIQSPKTTVWISAASVWEIAIKYATETVYAAAGVANLVAEKAKVFFDQQRKQLAQFQL